MKELSRLAGTWNVTGGAEGTVTYRWLEGGHFLLQDIDLRQDGEHIQGLEVIGREKTFGATEPSEDIKSRYYGSDGSTFDYVYDPQGDTLIIWGMEKGSPAYFKGTWSEDGDTLDGAWVYPGGGGYPSTMTRVS
jgi:hypothetical protein